MNHFHFIIQVLSCSLLSFIPSTKTLSQCVIGDLVITQSSCDADDNVDLTFDFVVSGGSNSFQILGNGLNYGTFNYSDLPITLSDIAGNCDTDYEFIVRDLENPSCASFVDYGPICCDIPCDIGLADVLTSDCVDGLYDLTFDITGIEGGVFNIFIDDVFFSEVVFIGDPVMLTNLDFGTEKLTTLTICDGVDADCCATYIITNPCACYYEDITTEIVDCDNISGSFYVILDFDYGANSDSFLIGNSANFLGTFAYSDLPIPVGPIDMQTSVIELLLVDKANPFCFESAYIGIVEDCNIECQIYNVYAEATECQDGNYYIDFEFDAQDILGNDFTVLVDNTSYGVFQYGSQTYTAGPVPSNCNQIPTLVILDNTNSGCNDFFNFDEPICCMQPCAFEDIITNTLCDGAIVYLNIEFINAGALPDHTYSISIAEQTFGPYAYSSDLATLNLGSIEDGNYLATIVDNQDSTCTSMIEVMIDCIEDGCQIYDVVAEAQACDGTSFMVSIDFSYDGDVGSTFTVTGNGNNYGSFEYGADTYSIGPIVDDCMTTFEFVVSNQGNTSCSDFTIIDGPVCCENACEIRDLEVVSVICDDDNMIDSITIDFIYDNVPSDQFVLFIKGVEIGNYQYSSLPLTIDVDFAPGNAGIRVRDIENPMCGQVIESSIECPLCALSEIVYEIVDCTENAYSISIDLENNNTSSFFKLYKNNELQGEFEYDDLPLQLNDLNIGESYIYLIQDGNDETCNQTFEIALDDCKIATNDVERIGIIEQITATGYTVLNASTYPVNMELYTIEGKLLMNTVIHPSSQSYYPWSGNQLRIYIAKYHSRGKVFATKVMGNG